MRLSVTSALAFLGFSTIAPSAAMAWDATSHRIIANIATQYLAPAALEKITAMLEADTDTSTAHDIASAATWADRIQDRRSHNWHFVHLPADNPNIPAACFGQPPLPSGMLASKGPEQACAIDKIEQFTSELVDPKTAPEERAIALKFLLNLVSDIHQPLRVADENDSHGMQARVATSTMTPGDLFTFWDKVLTIELNVDASALTKKLLSEISEADLKQWSGGTPDIWVLEAHRLGVDQAYGMLGASDGKGNSIISDPDVAKAAQIAATQLSRAGVRLAFVLNEALAPKGVDHLN